MKGEFFHTIDAKGRLFVPVKFKEELGESFVVTKGLDRCLFVYSRENWDALEEQIRRLPLSKSRDLQRFFLSSAVDCTPDAQGRILIPQNLREFAQLKKEADMKVPRRHVELYDTIMGCLGYTSPDGGINENNNWCHIPQAREAAAN